MSFFHPMRTLSFVIVTAFAVGFVATAAHANKMKPLANHGPADVAKRLFVVRWKVLVARERQLWLLQGKLRRQRRDLQCRLQQEL